MTVTSHAATKTIKHTIKPGESLYTIAKKNHTTVDQLCKLNHIKKESLLRAGKTIKVPVEVKKKSVRSTGKHLATYKTTVHYKVKKGDTLSVLALRYHTTVDAIRKVNGLAKNDILKYGQSLKIPAHASQKKRVHIAKKEKKAEKKLAKSLKRLGTTHFASAKPLKEKHRYSLSDIVFGKKGDKESLSPTSKRIIELAKQKLGKRYVWGAVGQRNTFDCSGLTSYVCKANGIHIPRRAIEQSKYGKYVSRSELKPGDLVFFDTSKHRKGYVNHVGIYIGNGKFIHASSAKKKVVITSLNKPFYSQRFKGGRRVASL